MASIVDQMTAVYVFVDDYLRDHPHATQWRRANHWRSCPVQSPHSASCCGTSATGMSRSTARQRANEETTSMSCPDRKVNSPLTRQWHSCFHHRVRRIVTRADLEGSRWIRCEIGDSTSSYPQYLRAMFSVRREEVIHPSIGPDARSRTSLDVA